MALQVIGAGFGRTGTLSLKRALESLGLGPCYHMTEVFGHPGHIALWAAAARGETVDWDALFAGYASAVDWPAAAFWRELSSRYPAARVILSVRDPDRWYESARSTIFGVMTREPPPGVPALLREQLAMARSLVLEGVFGGRFDDPEHAKAVFAANTEAVRAALPPERLLVYEAGEGWEPLCRFLGRPVPDEPFPRVNTREDFHARFAGSAP